jgi:AcrR family transcriptional regulator
MTDDRKTPKPGHEGPTTDELPASAKERRKERLRKLQQAAILDAAEVIIVRDGYHSAKMSDIAKEAGFSTGSLYTYFAGKDEIFQHMIAARFDKLYEELEEGLARSDDFMELIGHLTTTYADFMEERRSFLNVIHAAYPLVLIGPATQAPDLAHQSFAKFAGFLERVIQMGIDEGFLRPLPAREMAAIFLGMVDSINQLWLTEDPPRPFAEIVPVVLDVLFNGVKT